MRVSDVQRGAKFKLPEGGGDAGRERREKKDNVTREDGAKFAFHPPSSFHFSPFPVPLPARAPPSPPSHLLLFARSYARMQKV